MNVKKTRVSLLVAILTVALMFSLFTVSAFAETSAPQATQAPASTQAPVSSEAPASTQAPASSEAPATSAAPATTPAATTSGSNTGSGNNMTDTIISLIVGGVILLVIIIVCVIKREKLGKFLRGLKSEMSKIVWLPKNQTLKNTVVVLIIIGICTVVVGVLDVAFLSLVTLFRSLF